MKKLILLIFLVISNFCFSQTKTETYIQSIKEIAIKQSRENRIPASIIIAQAIIESGSGTSMLASKANNHFGIKCNSDWSGRFIRKNDDKPNECFRKYDNIQQSFEDHSKILKTRERYKFLFKYDTNDYISWAYGLKKAGYATNPNYPKIIVSTINKYYLQQYDVY